MSAQSPVVHERHVTPLSCVASRCSLRVPIISTLDGGSLAKEQTKDSLHHLLQLLSKTTAYCPADACTSWFLQIASSLVSQTYVLQVPNNYGVNCRIIDKMPGVPVDYSRTYYVEPNLQQFVLSLATKARLERYRTVLEPLLVPHLWFRGAFSSYELKLSNRYWKRIENSCEDFSHFWKSE
jgi:hypothetical protein